MLCRHTYNLAPCALAMKMMLQSNFSFVVNAGKMEHAAKRNVKSKPRDVILLQLMKSTFKDCHINFWCEDEVME